MDGFWPDVLTKSKGKTAKATVCNIDVPKDELLVHLVQHLSPVLASGYGVVA